MFAANGLATAQGAQGALYFNSIMLFLSNQTPQPLRCLAGFANNCLPRRAQDVPLAECPKDSPEGVSNRMLRINEQI
jgi:hypothetical protein